MNEDSKKVDFVKGLVLKKTDKINKKVILKTIQGII